MLMLLAACLTYCMQNKITKAEESVQTGKADEAQRVRQSESCVVHCTDMAGVKCDQLPMMSGGAGQESRGAEPAEGV